MHFYAGSTGITRRGETELGEEVVFSWLKSLAEEHH